MRIIDDLKSIISDWHRRHCPICALTTYPAISPAHAYSCIGTDDDDIDTIRVDFHGPRPYLKSDGSPYGWISIQPYWDPFTKYRGVCLGLVPVSVSWTTDGNGILAIQDFSEPLFLIQENGRTVLSHDCVWRELGPDEDPGDFSPHRDPNYNPFLPEIK